MNVGFRAPPASPASSTSCRLLTADQWAAGPAGVALKQQGPYAYGALVIDLCSVTGDDGRAALNGTSLQPFMTYMTPTAWSFTAQTETTYDWDREQWSVIALPAVMPRD